jgi:hypothetical protein
VILLAHSGGHIIQGRRVIGRGFLLARRKAGITEFVEVHLNKIVAVFGCTALLLLALLTAFGLKGGPSDTVTSE